MLGNIILTCDLEIAMGLAPTHKIVCISDNMNEYVDFISATQANVVPILLPPYNVSLLELDGRAQEFDQAYMEYLYSPEPMSFIAVLLRALFNKTNLVIFTTKDEYRMRFMSLFVNVLEKGFGLTIGNNQSPSVFNPVFYPTIINTMFIYDTMNCDEFLLYYPVCDLDVKYHQNTILKLMNFFNPYGCETLTDGAKYFNNLLSSKNTLNQTIIMPFRKG